jgi:hypothetical protein
MYRKKRVDRCAHMTACAPSARALIISEPVRIPESKRTVSFPEA